MEIVRLRSGTSRTGQNMPKALSYGGSRMDGTIALTEVIRKKALRMVIQIRQRYNIIYDIVRGEVKA